MREAIWGQWDGCAPLFFFFKCLGKEFGFTVTLVDRPIIGSPMKGQDRRDGGEKQQGKGSKWGSNCASVPF